MSAAVDLLNAFTVDVEDYYQVTAFEGQVERSAWPSYESRVAANTRRLLRLLERFEVRGTFFVLGWVARRFPQLVREIQRAGHEVGSHSYWHRLVYRQSPQEFRDDLVQSRRVLEDVTGAPIMAYRAPSFSITRQSLWALDILVEEGFRHDSSIFPVYHDRYGIPDAQPGVHQIPAAGGMLWEFPASVLRWGGMNIPVSGGGYFRLYPLAWTLRSLAYINRRQRRPFMFYVHPWEVDPDQPRLRVAGVKTRFRHYVNLKSTHAKLEVLLGRFRFGRLSEVIEQHVGAGASPEATFPETISA